jgi:hypothetical protein
MGAVAIDCDRVVFYGDSLTLPAGAPIVAFSQKFSGQQALPTQVNKPKKNVLKRNLTHKNLRRSLQVHSL